MFQFHPSVKVFTVLMYQDAPGSGAVRVARCVLYFDHRIWGLVFKTHRIFDQLFPFTMAIAFEIP